jgi:hypothetical protein
MADNRVHSSGLPDDHTAADAVESPTAGAAASTPPGQQNDTAGLVLLINTVLGGLGTLHVTTKSTVVTLVSALMVFLITIVVLVAKRRATGEAGQRRGDDRGGK